MLSKNNNCALNDLIGLLKDRNYCKTLTAGKAKRLLRDAHVQVDELMQFADFDYPEEDCYGRKMIYDGGHFELLVMSWRPGAFSSIHTHGSAEWGVVQVYGKAEHNVYRFEDGLLSLSKKEITDKGTLLAFETELIHQMGNPASEPFISLHLYCATAVTHNVTAFAQNFDLEFNRIAYTTGGAFFNLATSNIHKTEYGVEATTEVFLPYAYRLMQYYLRQKQTKKIKNLKAGLIEQIRIKILHAENHILV